MCEADLTVFEIGATIANVITLALETLGAFALATLVFELWTIFAPVEVSTAEAWMTEEHSAPFASMAGAFEMVGACGVGDVPAVASVRRSDGRFRGLKLDSRPLWRGNPRSC